MAAAAAFVRQQIGAHHDRGLINPGSDPVEGGGAAQVQIALLGVAGANFAQDHERVDAGHQHQEQQPAEARQKQPASAGLRGLLPCNLKSNAPGAKEIPSQQDVSTARKAVY